MNVVDSVPEAPRSDPPPLNSIVAKISEQSPGSSITIPSSTRTATAQPPSVGGRRGGGTAMLAPSRPPAGQHDQRHTAGRYGEADQPEHDDELRNRIERQPQFR